ncbi:MAG: M20/M25/M40 family metallo-hydrolase, partial [Gemmatimonadaceae bacterium]
VCAHLDTVFDGSVSHRVERETDRLVGPGIGDNARGLAAMLAIVDALHVTGVRTRRPLLFAATTGEEGAGNLRGARHLFATSASGAHAAVALDGAGDDRVVTHALGTRRYRVTYRGAGGHSWASYGTPNAVHAAASLAATLAAWPLPGLPFTTLSVCRIGGGSAVNAIPGDAWLEIDVRSTRAADISRLDERIRRTAERCGDAENLRSGDGGRQALRLEIDTTGDRPGGALSGDEVLGHMAFEATRLIGRVPASAVASTDANVPLALGIPAIALGGGGVGGDAHTTREWYENRDGALGIARVLTVVVSVAGLA